MRAIVIRVSEQLKAYTLSEWCSICFPKLMLPQFYMFTFSNPYKHAVSINISSLLLHVHGLPEATVQPNITLLIDIFIAFLKGRSKF